MFEGAVTVIKDNVCPLPQIKHKAYIKTKYATIEQNFESKEKALDFIESSKNNFEVIGYEIKPIRG